MNDFVEAGDSVAQRPVEFTPNREFARPRISPGAERPTLNLEGDTAGISLSLDVRCSMLDVRRLLASELRMKSFIKYWLPVLLWLGLIFIGSTDLMSAAHTSRIIGPILRWFKPEISPATIAQVQLVARKTAHVTEYAILAMLLWRALRLGAARRMKMSNLFAATLVACTLIAMSDEFHQSFVASRTSSPHDVTIDIAGALVGLAVCWRFAAAHNEH